MFENDEFGNDEFDEFENVVLMLGQRVALRCHHRLHQVGDIQSARHQPSCPMDVTNSEQRSFA